MSSINPAINIEKARALANAIVTTAAGVAKELEKGIVGIPTAALIAAMGAVEIATIQSTSFGGGGGSGGRSLGGGSNGGFATAEPQIRDIPVFSAEDRNRLSIEVTISSEGGAGDNLAEA